MNKKDIRDLLISMRKLENEEEVNYLLGKLDLSTEEEIQSVLSRIGKTKESIIQYINEEIEKRKGNIPGKHIIINELFECGISNQLVHLHMPTKLSKMISEKGLSQTMKILNLYLLDAIEKIRNLHNVGNPKFVGVEEIYMLSPILIPRERNFLEKLDFTTREYKKRELQNPEFMEKNDEARLAGSIFGKDKNIGVATIKMDIINSTEWQEKRILVVDDLKKRGIIMSKYENEI